MLSPKRVKHRKVHRGRRAGLSRGQVKVQFGEYGLKALDAGWLTNRQIEAARIAMTRKIKRGGKVWINVYPDKPFTKKPAETRMGSGKGAPDHWVAVVLRGRVLLELAGVREDQAKEALTIAGHKFPMGTKIVKRELAEGETIELGRKAEMRAAFAAEGTLEGEEMDEGAPAVEDAADVPETGEATEPKAEE